MDRDAVHAVAQGRVWTGAQALDNGLLDEPGGWALTAVSAVPGTSPLELGTASSSQPSRLSSGGGHVSQRS